MGEEVDASYEASVYDVEVADEVVQKAQQRDQHVHYCNQEWGYEAAGGDDTHLPGKEIVGQAGSESDQNPYPTSLLLSS